MQRVVIGLLLLLLARVHYDLLCGKNGLRAYWQLKQALCLLEAENRQLAERNQQLLTEVHALADDLEAIEERARYELGMVRPDELFYRLLPSHSDHQP
jgi:cell division protein FtsB